MWGATPAPLPRRADGGRWVIRHAAGVTRYQHAVAGLTQELAVFVAAGGSGQAGAADADEHVRASRRRLSVFGYVEWCLGPPRSGEQRFVVTDVDPPTRRDSRAGTPTTAESRRARSRSSAPASRRSRTPAIASSSSAATARSAAPAALLSRAAGRADRRRPRSVRRAAGRRSSSSPASRAGSRSCSARAAITRMRATLAERYGRLEAGRGGAGRDRADVGRLPRRRAGAHARRFLRPDRESLAALPDARAAASGRAAAPISPAARSASAISCRTCWRCCTRGPSLCRAHLLRGGVAAVRRRATCSTGGIRRAAAARARAAPTTCCGCRTASPRYVEWTRRRVACSTRWCRSSRRRCSSRTRTRPICCRAVSPQSALALRARRARHRRTR